AATVTAPRADATATGTPGAGAEAAAEPSESDEGTAHVPALPDRTDSGELIYDAELVDEERLGGGDYDEYGDGYGEYGDDHDVPDDEPVEVPPGRLTVRDIMLRLEWEKREALGPGADGDASRGDASRGGAHGDAPDDAPDDSRAGDSR
ncbi:MAG TPA: hypothetical protein GXZ46_01220, partial [Actinomycetales bacterium]|nr:hypothetical protein [Actinomycetales bacterium]